MDLLADGPRVPPIPLRDRGARLRQALRLIGIFFLDGLVALGFALAGMRVPGDITNLSPLRGGGEPGGRSHHGERGTPAGHPERLIPHVLPDAVEQDIWRHLGGLSIR